MNLPLGRRAVLSMATAALVAASGLALAQEGKGKAKSSRRRAPRRPSVLPASSSRWSRSPRGRPPADDHRRGQERTSGPPDRPADDQHRGRLARLGPRPGDGRRHASPPGRTPRKGKIDRDQGAARLAGHHRPGRRRPRHPRRDPVPLADRRDEQGGRDPGRGTRGRRLRRPTPPGPKPRTGKSKSAEKGPRFGVGDLKPGLFVEAEYRHVTAQNPASVVTVIRPIGGPGHLRQGGGARVQEGDCRKAR